MTVFHYLSKEMPYNNWRFSSDSVIIEANPATAP